MRRGWARQGWVGEITRGALQTDRVRLRERDLNLMASTDWARARRFATWRERDIGIPGDAYQVEMRSRLFYVIDRDSRGISAGPFPSREEAQRKADQLNQTLGRSPRGR
jgi:hypothetical protein